MQKMKGDTMIYSKLIVSIIIFLCIASALADDGLSLPNGPAAGRYNIVLAFNDRHPPMRANAGGPAGRPGSNAGPRNPQRGARVGPSRNQGFGYGFERRHAQRQRPGPPQPRPF
ncbi:MAG: hypothetical protein ACYCSS_00725 [Sulfuriferula sp.]